MEQKLGVLGGMGPQATQVFYQFVLDRTDAARDQDHIPALILSDTGIPDRTQAILSGETGELYQRLLKDARLLENCGCTAIAIPCNTSHYFVDKLQEDVGGAHSPHDPGDRPGAGPAGGRNAPDPGHRRHHPHWAVPEGVRRRGDGGGGPRRADPAAGHVHHL